MSRELGDCRIPECLLSLAPMSAFGTKRTSTPPLRMSAFGGKADIGNAGAVASVTFHGNVANLEIGTFRLLPLPEDAFLLSGVSLGTGSSPTEPVPFLVQGRLSSLHIRL